MGDGPGHRKKTGGGERKKRGGHLVKEQSCGGKRDPKTRWLLGRGRLGLKKAGVRAERELTSTVIKGKGLAGTTKENGTQRWKET